MQQQLINHSPDLKKLQDEGYELEIDGGYLSIRHIPYVDSDRKINFGTLVCVLTMTSTTRTGQPRDHTIFFSGEKPCDANGNALEAIINNSDRQKLSDTIIVDHYFSSRPAAGNYPDFYEKVSTYARILGSQAQSIDNRVTWKPLKAKNNEYV